MLMDWSRSGGFRPFHRFRDEYPRRHGFRRNRLSRPPTYLVRDNDRAYGQAFQRRIRAMGIRDRPISPRSPCQNPSLEALFGPLRRRNQTQPQAPALAAGPLSSGLLQIRTELFGAPNLPRCKSRGG